MRYGGMGASSAHSRTWPAESSSCLACTHSRKGCERVEPCLMYMKRCSFLA